MAIQAGFMVPHPPLIIPQVGKGSEEQVRSTIESYERVAEHIARIAPETIIISSPHAVMYADYFHISPGKKAHGSFSRFGAGNVKFEETYDTELTEEICRLADAGDFPAGVMGEREKTLDHGVMVPLYFIRRKYQDFRLVRIGLSGLSLAEHYELGMMIREAVNRLDRKAVFVASGDLSHKLKDYGPYGFAEEGPLYDSRIMDVCQRGAFGEMLEFDETFCEKASECGHRSFVMMAGAFDGLSVEAKALSHEDVTGVGYGICEFYPKEENADRHFLAKFLRKTEKEIEEKRQSEDDFVRLARRSLESRILEGEELKVPEDLPQELLTRRAGVFVSLHEHGKLRGCIGTIQPVTGCIAEEIIRNAISASMEDPRFSPVRPEELKWLEISVDVLGSPEKIEGLSQLDVKRYGVIVSSGRKRGLLLPDLDGVDTPELQVAIAKRKAGISEREPVQLERFEVVRHI